MKVLWITNCILPLIADYLGVPSSVKEGWVVGMFGRILADYAANGIELSVAFPHAKEYANFRADIPLANVSVPGLTYSVSDPSRKVRCYGFYENVQKPEKAEDRTIEALEQIIRAEAPDIVHVFGTEYPHCLAALKATDKRKVLIGLQGLTSEIGKVYEADLPKSVVNRYTFRDLLKHDNIKTQKKKFLKRGENEIEALQSAAYLTGRTTWDKNCAMSVNSKVTYIYMGETLRSPFYEGSRKFSEVIPGRIFLSQADYPLKGLHYVLEAMPQILKEMPEAHIRVAGQNITKHRTLKEKLKLSSYGKYLLKLMKQYHLEDKVEFLGSLDAQGMKEEYLKASVFVCPSKLENSPNSLGEAMMMGTPVVAARVGGIPDMITKEEGLLYEDGDIETMAENIIRAMTPDPEIKAMATRARSHALCNHDADANYHSLLQIYSRILGASRG